MMVDLVNAWPVLGHRTNGASGASGPALRGQACSNSTRLRGTHSTAHRRAPSEHGRRIERATGSGTADHEHVLPAVLGQRAAFEVPVERFQSETGNVDEAEPLVLGGPPQ
jgi:hypothetical protein